MSSLGDQKLSSVVAKAPADSKADGFTAQEELDLPARKRVDYEHRQLVQRLDRGNDALKAECTRLKDIEIQHARLHEKRKGDRWKDVLATLLMGAGGVIVGQSLWGDVWQGVG